MEKDHEEARRIAEESMVLLKNADQILPLKTSEKVAFVGGFAKNLVSRAAEALILTALKLPMHWKLFLLMHRLFTQKDFLLIKIYTMKNWLLKHFRLQKLLIRL